MPPLNWPKKEFETNYKQRNDLLAVLNLIYPHLLVKATYEISTEAETTKTKDHKAQLEEVFDLKGALPSNQKSLNPLLAFAVDLCAFLC